MTPLTPHVFADWFRALVHGRRASDLEHNLAKVKAEIDDHLVSQLIAAEKINKAACDLKKLTEDMYREMG